MATDVIYNGVKMHNVVTRQWDQTVNYDPSDTDVVSMKFSLGFEGIIHSEMVTDPAFVGPQEGPTDTAVPTLVWVRKRLRQPRKALIVKMGVSAENPDGENVLTCYGVRPLEDMLRSTAYYDVANGPKPREVNVLHVAGNRVLRVLFSVECEVLESPDDRYEGSDRESIALNNRWSVQEDMDANFYVTKTLRGRVRFKGAESNLRIFEAHAHTFRQFIRPKLEDGFRRDRVHFVVDPSGLAADYEVIDRQVHTAAPWPATKIDGRHSEQTARGSYFETSVSVKLEGPPDADKRLLLQQAVRALDTRIHYVERRRAGKLMCKTAAITDLFGGDVNAVQAEMVAIQYPGTDDMTYWTNLIAKYFGKRLELTWLKNYKYDPTVSRDPEVGGYQSNPPTVDLVRVNKRGLAESFVVQCYLQEPTVGRHDVPQDEDDQRKRQNEDNATVVAPALPRPAKGKSALGAASAGIGGAVGGLINVLAGVAPLDQDVAGFLNPGGNRPGESGIYTFCSMASRYVMAGDKVQMPIAAHVTSEMDDGVYRGSDVSGHPSKKDQEKPTSVVFTLAKGVCRREVTVEAERIGSQPQLPAPVEQYQDGGLTACLLDHDVQVQAPSLSPDAKQPIFRCVAHYVYAMNRPPRRDEKLSTGILPYTLLAARDTHFDGLKVYDEKLLNG